MIKPLKIFLIVAGIIELLIAFVLPIILYLCNFFTLTNLFLWCIVCCCMCVGGIVFIKQGFDIGDDYFL